MQGFERSGSVWIWATVGFAGSLLTALAGPAAVSDSIPRWWFAPGVPGGRSAATVLVYVGMAVLCIAWLALGRLVSGDETRALRIIAAAWLLPLALGPALFSRDVYSYLAQGTILHLGDNPYRTAPAALAGLGRAQVLAAVSPFWRHTTAPYGPLFLGVVSVVVGVTGSHLVAGVLVIRGIELIGVVLLAHYVPLLARELGAGQARATWLAVMSPLLAFELIAAGHNDVLMVGVLVAGVATALRGRPVLGVAICALAATVKVPALVAAVFIMVAWARAEVTWSQRVRFLLEAGLAAAAVLAAVSAITGLGLSWLTTSLFSTPAKVHLAITPSTAVGYTVAALLRDAGVSVGFHSVESALGTVTVAITAVLGAVLLYRTRIPKLALYLGWLLLFAAAGGPAAWPWYFTWGLALLAGCPGPQRSMALALGSVVAVFLIKPNGILALPVQSSPAVLGAYALLGVIAWHTSRGSRTGVADQAPSALAGT